ncbi:MAG: hypothetical protein R2940_12275 [Syntrophotaleaceae bacterium]
MDDWEAICNRCGQCCFEKWVEGDGVVHVTPIACRYLDIVSRECKVYHKRFEVGERCMKLTPELVRSVNWLPPDCAYVLFVTGKDRAGGAPREE